MEQSAKFYKYLVFLCEGKLFILFFEDKHPSVMAQILKSSNEIV